MKKLLFILAFLASVHAFAQTVPYKVGDKVDDFSLLNVKDNSNFSLKDLASAKAVVIIFTSHNCPYTKIYEQRTKNFIAEYEAKGVKFIFINPNSPSTNPEDSPAEMAKAAAARGYSVPYLCDSTQKVADKFGATKTPEVFVLKNQGNGSFVLKYKGAIDDNPQVAADVASNYLKEALEAVLTGQPVKITEKRATGCMIHK